MKGTHLLNLMNYQNSKSQKIIMSNANDSSASWSHAMQLGRSKGDINACFAVCIRVDTRGTGENCVNSPEVALRQDDTSRERSESELMKVNGVSCSRK